MSYIKNIHIVLETQPVQYLAVAYLVAAVLFILGLKGLASPRTARAGNLYCMAGMTPLRPCQRRPRRRSPMTAGSWPVLPSVAASVRCWRGGSR